MGIPYAKMHIGSARSKVPEVPDEGEEYNEAKNLPIIEAKSVSSPLHTETEKAILIIDKDASVEKNMLG